MQIPIARAQHLIRVMQFFSNVGTPVYRELNRAGLPENIEERPDCGVSYHSLLRFRSHCQEIEGIRQIGFENLGAGIRCDLHQRTRRSIRAAATLSDALRQHMDGMPLDSNYIAVRVAVVDKTCNLTYAVPQSFQRNWDSELYRLRTGISVIRQFLGQGWNPPEMSFTSKLSNLDELRESFPGVKIRGDQRSCGIKFSAELLSTVHPASIQTNAGAERKNSADEPNWPNIIASDDAQFIHQLRCLLKPYVGSDLLRLETAAEISGLSKRSLQRMLHRHGTSFQQVINDCKFEAAKAMLADGSPTVKDIATELGYSDQAHFSRAFKKQCGVTPTEFRQRDNTKTRDLGPVFRD